MVVVILVFSCGVVIVGSLSARPPFGATVPRAAPPGLLLAMDPLPPTSPEVGGEPAVGGEPVVAGSGSPPAHRRWIVGVAYQDYY